MKNSENIIEPGTVIDDKYIIGRTIGSGGMGTVYEAVHKKLKSKVAIKLLHNKYAKSSKIIKRFHQEAKLAAEIEHDNICKVIDHGTDKKGAPYLVMPMLSGESLAEILSGKKKISLMRIVDIACQTLSALEAAHKENIVHRDLKPDNIFVTKVGDREDFVKLLDFGISKVLEKESQSSLTSTGMVLGTAYYLAPEQARGAKNIDCRVDIFAMGVILYEALTGKRPFEGDSYNEIVFKIAGEPVKMPRLLNPAIPKSVEHVILKAMSVDPNDRFADAAEMEKALENAVVNADQYNDDSLADTMSDTVADTETPIALKPAFSNKKSRFIILAFVISVITASVSYLILNTAEHNKDQVVNKTSSATDSTNTEIAPSKIVPSKVEHTKEASSLPEKSQTSPKISEPAAIESLPPKDNEEIKSSNKTTQQQKQKQPKTQSQPKTDKESVIKGKFNTTFVFESD